MELSNQILSEITVFSKYAKFIEKENRRESWLEIVSRYLNMMKERYPSLTTNIDFYGQWIYQKKILPSMRAMQFAGQAIAKNESRIYNCAYLPVDSYHAFSETMFLLLGGTGVGYSVQFHHINQLPAICKPGKERKYLIGDSIEGWADAVKALMKSYFGLTKTKPVFDFSDIRQKGARLITAGGKAPGPEPLKLCLAHMDSILSSKEEGSKLTPVEAHDIMCHIANAVLAGGIRRAAMIALFSKEDEEMLTCKFGDWWELNEQRGRANNSVILDRSTITKEEFDVLWKKVEMSNAGEPGIYFTDNIDWGTNPCCEIALEPFQFCNLCEINASDIIDQEDFEYRAIAASFFGTLQAGFTDFHYLRPIWKEVTERSALIGVGITGIGSNKLGNIDLRSASRVVRVTNAHYARIIGINPADRNTTVKPSGTTSCVLGTSSGVHAWHDEYYLRLLRVGKNEALYTYLIIHNPEMVEDDFFRPTTQAVICVPQKAPEGAILRSESALDLLNRVKHFNINWVKTGHVNGSNANNVSATISINKDKKYYTKSKPLQKIDEWEMVGDWMWENKDTFNGLSVLPYDGGSYIQAPFTTITKEEYETKVKALKEIDLTKVIEIEDNTTHTQEAACAGGQCSIN